MHRGDALRNPLQNTNDRRTGMMGPLPKGSGEGIVDTPTTAMIVENGGTSVPMNARLRHRLMATWTAQALGVKHRDQKIVTLLLIHKVSGGKFNHRHPFRYDLLSSAYQTSGIIIYIGRKGLITSQILPHEPNFLYK